MSSSASDELDWLVEKYRAIMTNTFGPANLFEHGAIELNSNFGCGIDHAHLHIACFPFDLAREISAYNSPLSWNNSIAPWKSRRSEAPYLSVQSHNGGWMESKPPDIPKQYFRQVVAKAMGLPNSYDYDLFPNTANVVSCINKLADFSSVPA
jgi:ATP adenylyltransferase